MPETPPPEESGCLCGLFVGVVLVVAALRRVFAVIAQLGQLFIKGLDGGFLLAKDFLYQLVAMGFERLLLIACAVIRTKKARKSFMPEYNPSRMNLLR